MKKRLKLSDKSLSLIRTKRIKSFLYDYFKNDSPATFTLDGRIQCGIDRHRTFNDLVALVKYYIPSATKKKIAHDLLALSIKYCRNQSFYRGKSIAIGAIACNDVMGCTFGTRYYYFTPYGKDIDYELGHDSRDLESRNAISYDNVEKLAIEYGKDLLQRKAK